MASTPLLKGQVVPRESYHSIGTLSTWAETGRASINAVHTLPTVCCNPPPPPPPPRDNNLHVRVALHALQAPADRRCPSSGYALHTASNLLVAVQLEDMRRFSQINQIAMLAALLYVAIMITLCILNALRCYYFTHPFRPGDAAGRPTGSSWERPFHLIEFWTNVFFNIITGVVLLNTTSDSFQELTRQWPTVIKRVALFDIVSAFVAAILISIDLPYFESCCHNIEFVTTICAMIVNYILWLSLNGDARRRPRRPHLLRFLALLTIGFTMLILYNSLPAPWNEFASHFVEFPTDVVGGLVVFFTTAESKRRTDLEIFSLMYKPCKRPACCEEKSETAVRTLTDV